MLIACLVLTVALLVNQIILLVLFVDFRKKAATARTAALQYIDKTAEHWARFLQEQILVAKNQTNAEIDGVKSDVKGLHLDYNQAQAAASQINNYAQGIADIFNYDPLTAMQSAREKVRESN